MPIDFKTELENNIFYRDKIDNLSTHNPEYAKLLIESAKNSSGNKSKRYKDVLKNIFGIYDDSASNEHKIISKKHQMAFVCMVGGEKYHVFNVDTSFGNDFVIMTVFDTKPGSVYESSFDLDPTKSNVSGTTDMYSRVTPDNFLSTVLIDCNDISSISLNSCPNKEYKRYRDVVLKQNYERKVRKKHYTDIRSELNKVYSVLGYKKYLEKFIERWKEIRDEATDYDWESFNIRFGIWKDFKSITESKLNGGKKIVSEELESFLDEESLQALKSAVYSVRQ